MVTILQIYLFILPFALSLGSPWRASLHSFYIPSFLFFLGSWIVVKGLSLKKLGSVKYPILFFFLALLVSVTFSTDRMKSFHESYFYALALLLFLATFALPYNDKSRIIKALLLSAFLVSLLAIHQYFVIFPEVIDYLREKRIMDPFLVHFVAQKRVLFPFTTPNILGGYLAMLLPLTLILEEGKVLILVSLVFTLVLTQSLSGLLSLFFSFVIFFFITGQFKKKRSYFLLLTAGAAIAFIFFSRTTRCVEYLQPLFSWHMRFDYWKEAVKIIVAHPLTGVGLATFDLPQCRYAHNSYLQIWGEMGILGIVSYLWWVGIVIVNALKRIKDSPHKSTLIALTVSLAAFLFHNVLDFSFFLPEVNLIAWVVLGLLYTPDPGGSDR